MLVAKMMRAVALRVDEDAELWALVGLLHDLDYDEVGREGNMRKHGMVAAEKLKDKLPEECLYAIKAHDYRTGFKPESRLDKALIAVDTVAIVVERSRRTIEQLDAAMLSEEVERASVSQPWFRDNVLLCRALGLDVDEFLRICLTSGKKQ